jgi:hypothetical protein
VLVLTLYAPIIRDKRRICRVVDLQLSLLKDISTRDGIW